MVCTFIGVEMATYGLDFGTTNSSLSMNTGNSVRMIGIDPFSSNPELMRSVLFFTNGGRIFTGQSAIDQYVEDISDGRFMRSFKTLLPSQSFTTTNVGGRQYDAVGLVTVFLTQLRQNALRVGNEVDKVVIGRPVVFSEDQLMDQQAQDRLLQAALRAGFKEVTFQYEPIAAALLFEASLPPNQSRFVLVGDFGGGTSDFTVMRVGANRSIHRKNDILSLGGVYIGGDTFDSALMWERVGHRLGRGVKYTNNLGHRREMPESIVNNLRHWHTISMLRDRKIRTQILDMMETASDRQALENLDRLIDDNTGYFLFRCIEEAKCLLSSCEEATVRFDGLVHPISETIQRVQFEQIAAASLEKIERCVDDTIVASGLAIDQIDTVFLAGGTSQIPCVRRIFETKFGRDKLAQQDAFTSVAYGLGLSAGTEF